MDDFRNLTCQTCSNVGLGDGSDGFFYCLRCGSQYEDVVDTAVDDDDLFKGGDASGALYQASHQRQRSVAIKAEPISQYDSHSQLIKNLGLEDKTPHHHEAQVKIEPSSIPQFDWVGTPSVPEDFGGVSGTRVASYEDYYSEIRMRYVLGLQIMIEIQCEALVEELKVSPLICGLIGPIWLRFVSRTGVFDDDWADEVIHDSEMQNEEEPEDYKTRAKYRAEAHNMFGQRAVMIWFRSLKKRISLACTLAVSFLACHVAREAVLPSDIMKLSLEGKLPYFSAFLEIERLMGHPSSACPISSSVMFRPQRVIQLQKLEFLAASISQSIGLELPPVNFYAIAYRYLQKLSLPVENILPYACRISEWSMPPDLWLSLSTNYFRLPTPVSIMSVLVVAIRILYNINGLGEWEKSLSHNGGAISKSTIGSTGKDNGEMGTAFTSHDEHDFSKDADEGSVEPQKHELDSAWLLHHLQARYNEIVDTSEFSKDLPIYLRYCTDVVFAGDEPSFGNHDEQKMMEYLWNIYQNQQDTKPGGLVEQSNISLDSTRTRKEGSVNRTFREGKKRKECSDERTRDVVTFLVDDLHRSAGDDNSSEISPASESSDSIEHSSAKASVKEAIRQMKLDMEENRFCYIPPSVNRKRFDYLHYVRKRDEGALTYVAHADYYILLRACARVAQVDIRIMHIGVLSLERRLAWLEKRIDQSLHLKPPNISCQFCSDLAPENRPDDDIPELSDLNI